jgi:acetyltransferase-like isoleucine patch superfamily enzyme
MARPPDDHGSDPTPIASADLAAALRHLQAQQDGTTRQEWNRSLPLSEELFDRWERGRRLGFGEATSVYHHAYIYGDVSVGENTWIGPMTVLDGSGGLTIGSWCSISAGVHIYSHSTVAWAVSGGVAEYERARTVIGDRTFVGPLSVVAMGVTVGTRCVVGAHTFVNRDVPDGSVVVGRPGRIIGSTELTDDGRVRLVYADGSPHPDGP